MSIVVDKLAFESPVDRGSTCKAHYLSEPNGEALIELFRDGEPCRRFLFPAYKVWNISAHFADIVTSEIEGNFDGYDLAGWIGFSVITPTPVDAQAKEKEWRSRFVNEWVPNNQPAADAVERARAESFTADKLWDAFERCGKWDEACSAVCIAYAATLQAENTALRQEVERLKEFLRVAAATTDDEQKIAVQQQQRADGYDAQLYMTVARLGGTVEGYPTARLNFLQRIDELREIEAKVAKLEAELATQKADNKRLMHSLRDAERELAQYKAKEQRA